MVKQVEVGMEACLDEDSVANDASAEFAELSDRSSLKSLDWLVPQGHFRLQMR